jgi:ADP-ribose pyrophosphatase
VSDAGEELADVFTARPVSDEETVHQGMIWDVVRDTVDLGASTVRREYLRHPGAVTVLALDEQDRVLFLRQYRHPVRMELWELPAGLLDVEGEPPLLAAKRELAEEADLEAARWDVLIDWFNSPGGSDEALRCYLARDVTPATSVFERHDEELDMPLLWVPLEEARDAVLAGRVHNPGAALGVLAALAARELGWSTLRPGDAEWPEHPAHRTGG